MDRSFQLNVIAIVTNKVVVQLAKRISKVLFNSHTISMLEYTRFCCASHKFWSNETKRKRTTYNPDVSIIDCETLPLPVVGVFLFRATSMLTNKKIMK